jgi:hypothetical protein
MVSVTIFASEATPAYTREHSRLGSDVAFLREFVQQHKSSSGRFPCIYYSMSRVDVLWIDVGATSYFSILQTAGVMFKEETAKEIGARARRVAKFEMDRERRESLAPDAWNNPAAEKLFGVKFDCPPPTQEDLLQLCQEKRIDFIAIPQEFPGLYSATNGRLFLYETSQLRSLSCSARLLPTRCKR